MLKDSTRRFSFFCCRSQQIPWKARNLKHICPAPPAGRVPTKRKIYFVTSPDLLLKVHSFKTHGSHCTNHLILRGEHRLTVEGHSAGGCLAGNYFKNKPQCPFTDNACYFDQLWLGGMRMARCTWGYSSSCCERVSWVWHCFIIVYIRKSNIWRMFHVSSY